MNRPRIMPVLLIDERRAVKTQRFDNPVYIGDPINTTRMFSDKGVDELIVLDITSRKKQTSLDLSFISRLAEEAFMPFSFGGGIKSLNDAKSLFGLGIEKVVLGWEGNESLKLMSEVADIYGAQATSVCLDVAADGKLLKRCLKKGKHVIPRSATLSILKVIQEAGAGEVILQSVDLDGMMTGMDNELIQEMSAFMSIPFVALGGAGSLDDLITALNQGASAVASGSTFSFHNSDRAVLINYPSDPEFEASFKRMNLV